MGVVTVIRRLFNKGLRGAAFLVACGAATPALAKPPSYTLRLLDVPPGRQYCEFAVINDPGEVAARCSGDAPGGSRVVRWDGQGRVVWVDDVPGHTFSEVKGLNNQGLLLGAASDLGGYHGFLHDPVKGYRDMFNANGNLVGFPNDLNESGEVAISTLNSAGINASIYTEDGGIRKLDPRLPPRFENRAINDVGNAVLAGRNRFYLYGSRDQAARLPSNITWPTMKMNNHNQVVGRADFVLDNGSRQTHAFVWSPERGMQDLGLLGSETATYAKSYAFDINDAGQVVGVSYGNDSQGSGFVYKPEEGLLKLTGMTDAAGFPAAPVVRSAYSINGRGDIVAYITWEDPLVKPRLGVLSPVSP